jgi:hypothetical protein
MKIIVYHGSYGCDTGCCGHIVEPDDEQAKDHFSFAHPFGEDARKFAEDLIRDTFGEEHVQDLDWENSFICDE